LGATLYSDFRLAGEGREAGGLRDADRLEADENAGLKYFLVFGDRRTPDAQRSRLPVLPELLGSG
jgi:hypothetical protein